MHRLLCFFIQRSVPQFLTLSPGVTKTRNYPQKGDALPTHITACSNKKFWWICEYDHEWKVKVSNGVNGRGCPECYRLQRGRQEINLYDAKTLILIGIYDSIRSVCEYLD